METIILKGHSKKDAERILELTRKLNFSAKKITDTEAEELGLFYSIKEGIDSRLLAEDGKEDFIHSLKNK